MMLCTIEVKLAAWRLVFASGRYNVHHETGTLLLGDIVRRFVLLAALLLVAAPLQAQNQQAQRKVKRDPYRISTEELAEYGEAPLNEVIPKTRPNFLMFNAGGGAGLGEQTMTGVQYQLLVFYGTQQLGDTSTLRYYKASDTKEVRYYKPGNALSPYSAGTAFVIQIVPKDRLK